MSTRSIQLLFPMGGLGTRFSAAGFPMPKPLIPIARDGGIPLIKKALSGFDKLFAACPANVEVRVIFIVRVEHEEKFGLATSLAAACPGCTLVMLDHDTKGAVETCMAAAPHLDPNWPLVICDCDHYVRSAEFEKTLLRMVSDDAADTPEGLLVYMPHDHPRYSYCAIDPADGRTVTETAEKVVISNNALIGAYGFRHARTFVEAASRLLDLPLDANAGRKEYYVSLLYNDLIAHRHRVEAVERDAYASFGTPEELNAYETAV